MYYTLGLILLLIFLIDRNKFAEFINKYKVVFVSLSLVVLFNICIEIGESLGRFIYYVIN